MNWTTENLKEHFEGLRKADKDAIDAALVAADKYNAAQLLSQQRAVEKAENESKEWRNNANEWRGAMSDREKNFATKADVITLKERADLEQGKSHGLSQGWGIIIGVVGLIGGLIGIFYALSK
jgi:hypothetical protein